MKLLDVGLEEELWSYDALALFTSVAVNKVLESIRRSLQDE